MERTRMNMQGTTRIFRPMALVMACLGALAIACATPNTDAQGVTFSVSAKQTWVDVPLRLTFSVENATDIGEPVLPDVDGLSISYAGTTNQSTSITIINGVRSESRSVDLAIEVTPERAGRFTIPPIQIEIDGRQYSSETVTIESIEARNDGLVDVKITGNERPAYVGEPVALTLQIWMKPFHSDAYEITVPERTMWQLVDLQRSDWGPFRESLEEMVRARQRPSGRSVVRDGQTYYLYEIEREIRPTGLGEIQDLTDVTVAVSYPTGVQRSRSLFGSNLEFTGLMPIRVKAEVADINVKPLPEAGKPEYFRGAVGNFVVRAAARPTDVAVGDPITLTFLVGDVDGEVSVLDTLRPPPLAEMSELTSDFRISKDPIAGTVEGDVKLFTQSLRPRWDTITEIPPIPFSFFDPELGEYRTLHTKAIPIRVSPAETLSNADIVRSDGSETELRPVSRPEEDSEPLESSLLGNFPVSTAMLRSSTRTLGVATAALVAIPPAFFAVVALLAGRRRWREAHPALARARGARRRALALLAGARELPQIGRAVRGYVSDRSGRAATSLTSAETMRTARSAGADAPLIAAMDELLRTCERSGYGSEHEQLGAHGTEAERIIRALDRCDWPRPEEVTR